MSNIMSSITVRLSTITNHISGIGRCILPIVSLLIIAGYNMSRAAVPSRTLASVASPAVINDTIRTEHVGVDSTEIRLAVEFKIDSFSILPDYSDNAVALDSLQRVIARAVTDPDFSISDIVVAGAASPDGNYNYNMRLARQRMQALGKYIRNNYTLPEGISVEEGDSFVAWPDFRKSVSDSDLPEGEIVLKLASKGSDNSISDTHQRLRNLRLLDKGKVWKNLANDIFPKLRTAVSITLATETIRHITEEIVTLPADTIAVEPESVSEPAEDSIAPEEPVTIEAPLCGRRWHLETNALEWALAISNIGGEYDFANRWSVALSLHYSAWNYGKSTRKFRTFIFRPEARYWFRDCHKGFFLDAHLQMAAYNFALPSWKYRIQDVDGKNPALGGGIGVGYRVPISKNGHWSFQTQLGIGVYHLKYDRFKNRANGPRVDTRSRVWAGIDNFAISIVYNFNPKQ